MVVLLNVATDDISHLPNTFGRIWWRPAKVGSDEL
jgi:hypothetical protein